MTKLGFLAITALAFFATQEANAACGKFEVAKGDVKVLSGTTKLAVAAIAGTKICSGDAVISGKDSRAKLRMEDGNELNVSPDSKIILENYQFDPAQNKKKVLLNVLQGKIRAATKQENMYNDKSRDGADNTFQVKTKSAVAGVRGTDFLTGFDPKSGKSEVVTFRGKVDVGQPGPGGQILNPVQVGAGQKTEAALGQPPAAPRTLPAHELQQMNTDSKSEASNTSSGPSNGNASNEKKDEKKDDKKAGDKQTDKQGDKQAAGNDDKKTADDKKGSAPNDKQPASGEKQAEKQSGPNDGKSAAADGKSSRSNAAVATPAAGDSGPSGTGNSQADNRQPTSTVGAAPAAGPTPAPSVSLISNADLGTGSGPMTAITPVAPMMPLLQLPPSPTSAIPVVPVCQQCLDAVANSPTRLSVRIKIQ